MSANSSVVYGGAVWIGGSHPFDLQEAYLCFRSPVDWVLDGLPERAELFITAVSRYKLWVNGRFLTRGPARSYPHAQAVDQIEITEHLQVGNNLIAVQVYSPGYSHFAYLHRGMAGLLAWLVCDGDLVLETTSTWQTQRDPSFSDQVRRVSIYGSGVEVRDLRLATDWTQPNFTADGWESARVIAAVGGGPWTGLRPRNLPLLQEKAVDLKLVEMRNDSHAFAGTGRFFPNADPHIALTAGWRNAQPIPDTQFVSNNPGAAAAYWLFDLGRDYSCQGWVTVQNAQGGEQIFISYAEKMRDGELVLSDPATYCRVRLTDKFILREGDQIVEGFSLRGGRYILFGFVGKGISQIRLQFHAHVSQYPLQISRPLATGDAALDGIAKLCETTIHACLQDGFVDSVWRESSQWLGDALPQSMALWAMCDDVRPMRTVLQMAAQGAEADGILPSVMPGEVYAYTIPRYNFMWVELLQFYARVTGDDGLVKQLWPTLVKMLAAIDRWQLDNGLIVTPNGRRLYIDWSPTSNKEPHAVYNLHFVLALQQAVQLAAKLGKDEQADRWLARAQALQRVIRDVFWRNGSHVATGTGRWQDDPEQTTYSQLTAAFAVLTETTPPETVPALLDAIAHRSLDPDDTHHPDKMVLASPFMHHTLFEALRKGGRDDQVVEIIRLRWGRWLRQGYPTTWENWQVDFPDGSQCHAFAAHPRYHLSEIILAPHRRKRRSYKTTPLQG